LPNLMTEQAMRLPYNLSKSRKIGPTGTHLRKKTPHLRKKLPHSTGLRQHSPQSTIALGPKCIALALKNVALGSKCIALALKDVALGPKYIAHAL
jgi:hypothetical protein